MADEQLTPQVIPNTPIPQLNTDTTGNVSSGGADNGLSPATIPNAAIKEAPIASDVISTSIDSAQRKILGQFGFGQVGSFQIGQIKAGVQGEIKISPNGIIGYDDTGAQRFVLDDNGELILSNTLGSAILDGSGIISTTNFLSNEAFNGSAGLSTASTSFVDIPGSAISFTLSRTAYVLFFVMGYGRNNSAISSNLIDSIELNLFDSFIGGSVTNLNMFGATSTYTPDGINFTLTVGNEILSRTTILSKAAGTHNLKLQYRAINGGTAVLDAWEIGYTILGS